MALSGSLVGPLASKDAAPARLTAQHKLASSSLRADLIAGARTIKVPSNLRPPLSAMASALPRIIADGCELGFGRDQIKPCIYGDRGSHTTVVLFGDSHAGHWFDALNWISNRRHWRLVVMTKEGCTPAEVTFRDDPRQPVRPLEGESQGPHRQAPPSARDRLLGTMDGAIGEPEGRSANRLRRPVARRSWQRSFSSCGARRSSVIFISDTPYLPQSAPDCVAGHLSDVRPCTTKRSDATVLPAIKAAELRIAKQEQINSIDPTSWFCTPKVCPVIVGNILVYHDKSHMTTEWSRFIAPVLDNAILRTMRPAASATHRRSTATFRSRG